MKITWLGQAGLLFDNGKIEIMIDPYLSDSVERIESKKFRRMPIHFGMFDELDPSTFECDKKIIPTICEEITF